MSAAAALTLLDLRGARVPLARARRVRRRVRVSRLVLVLVLGWAARRKGIRGRKRFW